MLFILCVTSKRTKVKDKSDLTIKNDSFSEESTNQKSWESRRFLNASKPLQQEKHDIIASESGYGHGHGHGHGHASKKSGTYAAGEKHSQGHYGGWNLIKINFYLILLIFKGKHKQGGESYKKYKKSGGDGKYKKENKKYGKYGKDAKGHYKHGSFKG